MAERGAGLAIVAEPWRVPDRHPCWAVNRERSAAIYWRRTTERHVPCNMKGEGPGWVMVEWGPLLVVGVYFRPSLSRAELEERLEDLGTQIRASLPRPMLVAGDFNAKSALWGSRRPDCKGAEVEAWADRLGLHLMNTGSTSTCVRPQGESVVDITWISPAAARLVTAWRVAEEVDLLTDHLPLEMEVQLAPLRRDGSEDGRPLRWAIKRLDPDKLQASLAVETWAPRAPLTQEGEIEEEAKWLRRTMTQACDCAMPRATFSPRRSTYWWTEDIGDLRREVIRARRRVQRERRRSAVDQRTLDTLLEAWKENRSQLKKAIMAAKERAWEEAISSLEEDPWGRPYKLVLDRLSKGASPTVETLELDFLEDVVRTLFPAAGRNGPATMLEEDTPANDEEAEEEEGWREDLGV
ncbi:PREDICTED: uncharacterized protein LOC105556991 [Vollenhovia emeryi]|uniref:uncharacterized protein LOC105556991 n=1 Tax=Vollenhovia emeryi TaxID=411798 RepID=UPI0005F38443|nr:PREDICTED: uncharacterized protein LOC105556991 [Vollenhovia emeryi]